VPGALIPILVSALPLQLDLLLMPDGVSSFSPVLPPHSFFRAILLFLLALCQCKSSHTYFLLASQANLRTIQLKLAQGVSLQQPDEDMYLLSHFNH
jgi:hypothetical protein